MDVAQHTVSALDVADEVLTKEALLSWLAHPVTKALALVIALEVGYQVALRRGAKALGLVKETQ